MAGLKQVQRQTGVALWRQIADRIRQAISGGAYDETGMVPPETVLALQFGVNRHTVRSALAALAQEGIVRAVQGRGTLIERKERLNFPISRRTRFTGRYRRAGAKPGLSCLATRKRRRIPTVARWLQIGARHARHPPGDRAQERISGLSPVGQAGSRPRFAGMPAAYRKTESITRAFAELGLSRLCARHDGDHRHSRRFRRHIAAARADAGRNPSDHQGDEHRSGGRAGAIFDQPLLRPTASVHNRG